MTAYGFPAGGSGHPPLVCPRVGPGAGPAPSHGAKWALSRTHMCHECQISE